jgi:hypothetical protein
LRDRNGGLALGLRRSRALHAAGTRFRGSGFRRLGVGRLRGGGFGCVLRKVAAGMRRLQTTRILHRRRTRLRHQCGRRLRERGGMDCRPHSANLAATEGRREDKNHRQSDMHGCPHQERLFREEGRKSTSPRM